MQFPPPRKDGKKNEKRSLQHVRFHGSFFFVYFFRQGKHLTLCKKKMFRIRIKKNICPFYTKKKNIGKKLPTNEGTVNNDENVF